MKFTEDSSKIISPFIHFSGKGTRAKLELLDQSITVPMIWENPDTKLMLSLKQNCKMKSEFDIIQSRC